MKSSRRVGAEGLLTALSGIVKPRDVRPDILFSLLAAVAIDPSSRYLMAAMDTGEIERYRILPTGKLVWLGPTDDNSAQPTDVTFSQDGTILYLLNNRRFDRVVIAYHMNSAGFLARVTPLPTHPPPFRDNDFGHVGGNQMLLADAPAAPNWGQPSGGLKVAANLTQDVYQPSKPVALTVRLRNVTSHAIPLGPLGDNAAAFRLNVIQQPPAHDPYNRPILPMPVPLLAAGKDIFQQRASSGSPVWLLPGAERQYRFLLSRLADLSTDVGPTADETFTVQVSHPTSGAEPAASPVLTFRIDDPKPFQFWNEITFGPAINSQP